MNIKVMLCSVFGLSVLVGLSSVTAEAVPLQASFADITKEEFKAAKQEFKAAKQDFKDAKQQFKAGNISRPEFLAAKEKFQAAKQEFKAARLEYRNNTNPSAVPIPGTLLSSVASFAGFVAWHWRYRRHTNHKACSA